MVSASDYSIPSIRVHSSHAGYQSHIGTVFGYLLRSRPIPEILNDDKPVVEGRRWVWVGGTGFEVVRVYSWTVVRGMRGVDSQGRFSEATKMKSIRS